MPEVIVIDEIGSEAEALAAATIAQRGVQLVATAHGECLENILNNPTLQSLLGGVERSASPCIVVQSHEPMRAKVQETRFWKCRAGVRCSLVNSLMS